MRSNFPVTNVEYVLRDTQVIVSKTDLHGNITYINQDFIDISGFSEDELIGAPQNIVRHPDMPVEAFADFWRTLKEGKAWTGLVKNRCKNGDHYWVAANAEPIIENQKVVGYASIRMKPSRNQVQAAENAYRAIKAGDQSLEIREGVAVKRSLLQRFNLIKGLSLKTTLTLTLTLASVTVGTVFAGMGMLAWFATAGEGKSYLNWLMAISAIGVPLAGVFGVLLYRSTVLPLERIRF